jgi:hypothetical protein
MRALLSFRLHLLTNDRVLYEKKPVIYLRAPERGPRRYFPLPGKKEGVQLTPPGRVV